jgi:hypothetical protein
VVLLLRIVGNFDRDKLFEIDLYPFADYQGFLVYSGAIVNAIELTHSEAMILKKPVILMFRSCGQRKAAIIGGWTAATRCDSPF